MNNLIILAGGISSRMGNQCKCLLPMGRDGEPFLDYLLYNARESGYRNVVIVVGESEGEVRKIYGNANLDNNYHGLLISYAKQIIPNGRTKPLGSADALLQALMRRRDWAGQSLTVCNSDNLYSVSALKLLREYTDQCALIHYDRSALQFDSSRIEKFAVVQKNSEGFLTKIVEKPSAAEVSFISDNGRIGVSMNIFRFQYDMIFPFLEMVPMDPIRQEKELSQAVSLLILSQPKSMKVIPMREHVPDLTSAEDIANVQFYLQHKFPNALWRQKLDPVRFIANPKSVNRK